MILGPRISIKEIIEAAFQHQLFAHLNIDRLIKVALSAMSTLKREFIARLVITSERDEFAAPPTNYEIARRVLSHDG